MEEREAGHNQSSKQELGIELVVHDHAGLG